MERKIHKLTNTTWNTEKLTRQWKESITVPIYMDGKTDCSIY
jgi:hypothetical protein